jgi:hypothetical protein
MQPLRGRPITIPRKIYTFFDHPVFAEVLFLLTFFLLVLLNFLVSQIKNKRNLSYMVSLECLPGRFIVEISTGEPWYDVPEVFQ